MTNLSTVYLDGVSDALSTHSAAEAKGIKAHFRMDESGLLLLDYVESLFEYPPEAEEQSTFASECIHVRVEVSLILGVKYMYMHM